MGGKQMNEEKSWHQHQIPQFHFLGTMKKERFASSLASFIGSP